MPPWLVSAALAEGPPAPAPQDDAAEEIVVWGRAVEEARQAVIERLDALGYDKKKDRDGRTVFRNEAAWKGKVVLYDDAYLLVKRTGPRYKKIDPIVIAGTKIRPYPLCLVVPTACMSAGSFALSESRWRGVEDDVSRATAEPLSVMGDAMADQAIAKTLAAVPVALQALWEDGAPLVSEAPLRTPAERRVELLAFWDSRTENEWGRQVRDVVASFVRAVVQDSDDPYTDAEIEAFEARRRSSAPFPWRMDIEVGAE